MKDKMLRFPSTTGYKDVICLCTEILLRTKPVLIKFGIRSPGYGKKCLIKICFHNLSEFLK